jgi:hypothetical protein
MPQPTVCGDFKGRGSGQCWGVLGNSRSPLHWKGETEGGRPHAYHDQTGELVAQRATSELQ